MISKIFQIIAASIVLSVSSFASAALILQVDLSVENTITINALAENSSATVSGADTTGFYFDNFFANGSVNALGHSLISGDLTSALNTSDGTPSLFRHFSSDPGLNVFSYTDDAQSIFTLGELAFTGQASWTVSAGAYADALNGALSGDVYFAADDFGDLPGAQILGTWEAIVDQVPGQVPEPSTFAIIALGLLGFTVRKFKK
ncbi:PEP-CTERM sorting domain-containing protein [Aliiglaciecola sp. NS0011-25]|uniref:PEP-CTERM sorting domain-containing protein n=1 Tax=Aliiglaciecola sp. NS0011-25 TaxID=3127654 RepID=UPI0031094A11